MINSARIDNEKKKLIGKLSEEVCENDDAQEEKLRPRPWRFIVPVVVLVVGALLLFAGYSYVVHARSVPDVEYIGALPKNVGYQSYEGHLPHAGKQCELETDEITDIAAEAYIAVFTDSFQVAYSRLPHQKMPFASIVKLLGALVVVEHYELDQPLTMIADVDDEGNGLGLEVGETVSVRDLLGAALVGSKNDAMYVLAQNYPGGMEAFVSSMQEKAIDLGMENTSVANSIGLDDPDQYSTPYDIAILMTVAMRDPIISELVGMSSYVVTIDDDRKEAVWTTNILLTEDPAVIGGKTGFTSDAGWSLVAYIDEDVDFVTVVLNAEDRYEETRKLIDRVRSGYICK